MPESSWFWKFQIQISCQVSRWNTRWLQHFRYSIFWKASMCTYAYRYIHYFYLGKNKVTFWMKSAAFTSKPHGLWRKECYNITDPSRQPFPPLAPPIPTQMLESYSPTGESSLSYSLSILVMAFPHSAFSSLFHSSGTWPRQLSGL